MAHILIGWEFGANRGHVIRMAEVATVLREAGHRVSFAVSRLDAMHAQKVPAAAIWQAPVSPRLMAGRARASGPVVGMADILARLGMDDPLIVAAMVDGWRQLLGAIRPDLVIADYAPFLLLAVRGRMPAVSIGTGFSSPPSDMAAFPVLIAGAQGTDQAALANALNDGLAEAGEPPVAALPQIFAADRAIVATIAELDPYAATRTTPLALPEEISSAISSARGEEVFAYFPDSIPVDSPLWAGLAASGLKIRVHIGLGNAAIRAGVARHGLIVEPDPLPFSLIAERSRLLVSHGGHGIICAGLAAGLPHVVCHYDLEKLTHGLALARAGLGGHVLLGTIKPQPFADSLASLFNDEAIAGRARAAAPEFRARPQAPFRQAVLEAVAALA